MTDDVVGWRGQVYHEHVAASGPRSQIQSRVNNKTSTKQKTQGLLSQQWGRLCFFSVTLLSFSLKSWKAQKAKSNTYTVCALQMKWTRNHFPVSFGDNFFSVPFVGF